MLFVTLFTLFPFKILTEVRVMGGRFVRTWEMRYDIREGDGELRVRTKEVGGPNPSFN